jgi:hypothetical protein
MKVIDAKKHPDRHVPTTEFENGQPSGPTVEQPQVTKTGKDKKTQFPFHGANS